ncbi:uncharacterized protein SPSK_06727 [Sporothrix schenckii 1099-18]|uniref:Uncharacterized protein n=1 Tax=Sporothrix schenckii 1099-18 TaxID=1397361 RepID=A0A0F2MI02_SPOSC|nr:uncharacterized protein SPSK_06727 [Sporothrix schenckii 1099-18]KJR89262.1 hypothetical protein SPSK_06727 [Sporothrix schenckii 1099-18]
MPDMQEPMSAAWGLVLSAADWAKLRAGLAARDMDDRWRFVVDTADRSGVVTIHVQRSWTGTELYALHVQPGVDGAPARVVAITWEQNKNGILITEEQAKKEVAVLSRSQLGCDLEQLPDYDSDLLWNHPNARLDRNIN